MAWIQADALVEFVVEADGVAVVAGGSGDGDGAVVSAVLLVIA